MFMLGLIPGQVETATNLVHLLQDGGPWALMSIAFVALAWVSRAYVGARDERDKAVSDLNDKLTGLLKDMVTAAEQQKAANERIVDILDRIERRLENAPQKG